MTDNPTTPRATTCPDCRALIPATVEDRRDHRRRHTHDDKVAEAIRTELKSVRALQAEIASRLSNLEKDLDNIEIPEPAEPMTIEEWPDDELDDEDDDDEDDVDLETPSPYADDDLTATVALDPTDLPAPHTGLYTPADLT